MRKLLASAIIAASVIGVTASSASAATQPPEDTGDLNRRALVSTWYSDFLGRDADPGSAYWVKQLETKRPIDVLNELQDSPEFAEVTVETSYQFYLNRSAEPDQGANVWRTGIRGDMAPEWMDQNILASPEYIRSKGANPVDEWYTAVLGREGANAASPGEEAYWSGIAARDGALAAVRGIWYSPEAVDHRIEMLYIGLLGRFETRPSEGEVSYWRVPMKVSLKDTANAFAVTPEYQARANEEASEG